MIFREEFEMEKRTQKTVVGNSVYLVSVSKNFFFFIADGDDK